ncbi:MAG: DUF4234 domain-containing protein [Myxococcaceae bacterium]|nr:DUF4234 domain-containing protein [Myxococcaceae bacterium]MCA3013716.1 DUF4234 domain-containing protein [Myxococcaceae bacterium]
MQRRDLVVVALLSIVTCGLYAFYWQYQTTVELKAVTGKADLNPGLELLLSLVTCGIFGIYVRYRNTQLVTEQLKALRGAHEDKAVLVLILDLAAFVVGITFFAAVLVAQSELNALADARSGGTMMPPQPVR